MKECIGWKVLRFNRKSICTTGKYEVEYPVGKLVNLF